MTKEEITELKQDYMDYLRNVILNRLDTLEQPEILELKILLYDVRYNLELMLQSEEQFNDDISLLMQYSKTRRK